MTSVEIQLLGRFEVKVDGRSVPATAWRHRKAAGLVKLLALASGNRLHREQVIESLWPHLSPDAGDRNLHKAIHLARKEIGDPAAITLSSQEVGLGDVVSVDVERFESEAGRALRAAEPGACASVAILYTGELLPEDRYEEWTQPARERLQLLYGELLRCAERWSDLLEIEPLDEEAHRVLIRAYAEAGNRAAALRQFARLKGLLGKELGLRPAPESVALYEEIARGRPWRQSPSPSRWLGGSESWSRRWRCYGTSMPGAGAVCLSAVKRGSARRACAIRCSPRLPLPGVRRFEARPAWRKAPFPMRQSRRRWTASCSSDPISPPC
jgi:DNA-binding SARP family transcriptional activator